MLNKKKTFRGGYKFRAPDAVFSDVIETAPVPERVTIPLRLRFSSTITPIVKEGDKVYAGQIIARDDNTVSTPAISSVNGIVEDFRQIDCHYGKVDGVVIKSDGTNDIKPIEGAQEDFESLSIEKVNELLYTSGVTALGKTGIPTTFKSSPARSKDITNLVITTFGTNPYALDDTLPLKEAHEKFYKGILILKRVLPEITVTIVVDNKKPAFIKELMSLLTRSTAAVKSPNWLFIQPVDKKYPQESEDILARTLFKKKIPLGGMGIDIGMLVLDIHDIVRVYEAVAEGKPLVERTVSIAGSACKESKMVNIRIGISVEDALKGNLKEGVEPRIIFGSSMSGLLQKDTSLPVGRSIGHITVLEENTTKELVSFMRPGLKRDSYSNAFLSALVPCAKSEYNTNMHGDARPCVQCGYCDEVCPVGIIPHLLSRQIKHDICDETEHLGIFDCMDCGLCSYVCPCKIPLADDITKGKKILIEDGCTVFRTKLKESEEAVKAYRGRMPL